jgi:transcriptional regulator with XRE-family HTH domain
MTSGRRRYAGWICRSRRQDRGSVTRRVDSWTSRRSDEPPTNDRHPIFQRRLGNHRRGSTMHACGRVNDDAPNVEKDSEEHDYLVRVGTRLRRWRTHVGISQDALAGLAGTSRSFVVDIEGAKSSVRITHLRRLACGLGIEVRQLVPLLDADRDIDPRFDPRPPVPFALSEAAYDVLTPDTVARANGDFGSDR